MRKLLTPALLVLAVSATLAATPLHAQTMAATLAPPPATEGQTRAAAELLDVLKMDKIIRDAVVVTIDAQAKGNPLMAPYRSTMMEFVGKYLSWEALKPELIRIYAEAFTEAELRELTAFHRSAVGQKLVAKTPELMARSSQLGQDQVQKHTPELMEMIQKRQKELEGTAAKGDTTKSR